jgi:hypothetical protein
VVELLECRRLGRSDELLAWLLGGLVGTCLAAAAIWLALTSLAAEV